MDDVSNCKFEFNWKGVKSKSHSSSKVKKSLDGDSDELARLCQNFRCYRINDTRYSPPYQFNTSDFLPTNMLPIVPQTNEIKKSNPSVF